MTLFLAYAFRAGLSLCMGAIFWCLAFDCEDAPYEPRPCNEAAKRMQERNVA